MITYRYTSEYKIIEQYCNDKEITKLHANGLMSYWWEYAEDIKSLAIAFDNETPIGACICPQTSYCDIFNIGVFVKKAYRRRGIGTRLAKLASTKAQLTHLQADTCGEHRRKFFQSVEQHIESKQWQKRM